MSLGTQVALLALLAVLWLLYKRIQPQGPKYPDLEKVIEPLPDFDWATASPRALRPFRPIYHITMALQSDTPSDLITIDRDYLDRVNLRRSLIEKYPDTVHGCTEHGGAAVEEVYSYLMEYLPMRYPTVFNKVGVKLYNRATGKMIDVTPPADSEDALKVLGETVEEDLFLLRKTDDGHESVAFMCCFPSGFDPSRKLGRLLKDIHEGVPAYEKIGASMERFFSKLEVGKSVKRINWSFQTHEDLFNCKGNHGDQDDKEEEEIDIDKTFARMELQTLTRLPKTKALLFSFKTYLYPVRELKEEGIGEEIAEAIEGLGKGNAPGMWKYKGTVRWGKRVCEYLRA